MLTELFDNRTHNIPPQTRICHNKRPCYRVLECKVCWNKQRKHIISQVIDKCSDWQQCSFCTLTIANNQKSPASALVDLAEIRKKLHRAIFKKNCYLSLIAIAINSNGVTPHFHILVDRAFDQKELHTTFARYAEKFGNINVNIKDVMLTPTNLRRIAGYLMDQNYKTTLQFRPPRLRELTH